MQRQFTCLLILNPLTDQKWKAIFIWVCYLFSVIKSYSTFLDFRQKAVPLPERHVSQRWHCRGCQSLLWSLHLHHLRHQVPPSPLPLYRMCQWDTPWTPRADVLWHSTSHAAGLRVLWEQGRLILKINLQMSFRFHQFCFENRVP